MATNLIATRHSTYGCRQWGVFDLEANRFIEIERRSTDGAFRGYVAFFERKRDAETAIRAIRDKEKGI